MYFDILEHGLRAANINVVRGNIDEIAARTEQAAITGNALVVNWPNTRPAPKGVIVLVGRPALEDLRFSEPDLVGIVG